MDINKFYRGEAFDAYTYFGAHPLEDDGYIFRVYAPNAERVRLIGDFSDWEELEMEPDDSGRIYEAEVSGAEEWNRYKYRIYTPDGSFTDRCDPYGFGMELRPGDCSVIRRLDGYTFTDAEWMSGRDKNYNRPMNIYEMHLGSWKENTYYGRNGWYNYAELADILIPYLLENGYTHVEFMPLSEHPADESWGYQNTGFYAPTSRYGTAAQLQYLVDRLHGAGLGAILDFVPVHFAVDDYALKRFDGTELYEYPNDVGESEWGSINFNVARGEVCSFLQSAANYWLSEYHFDGLRMDAVSRIIFWLGDPKRGVNQKAIEFISNMNKGLHERHPSAALIAEDSTNFLKVTAPVEYDGLGFDYKWDMGWMNDTLEYFRMHPMARPNNSDKITFSMAYFYNELYLLPLSHDEVVHGKATIIQKMWGDYDQKFPQARALYLYMYTHPGKKLNFMGNEFAQFREWAEYREQDWDLHKYPLHESFHQYMIRLNNIYKNSPALYSGEYNSALFKWLIADDKERAVFAYERGDENNRYLIVLNFSDVPAEKRTFSLDGYVNLNELICSESEEFGGNVPPGHINYRLFHSGGETEVEIDMPPFSGQIFEIV